jgi:hypothetical protein
MPTRKGSSHGGGRLPVRSPIRPRMLQHRRPICKRCTLHLLNPPHTHPQPVHAKCSNLLMWHIPRQSACRVHSTTDKLQRTARRTPTCVHQHVPARMGETVRACNPTKRSTMWSRGNEVSSLLQLCASPRLQSYISWSKQRLLLHSIHNTAGTAGIAARCSFVQFGLANSDDCCKAGKAEGRVLSLNLLNQHLQCRQLFEAAPFVCLTCPFPPPAHIEEASISTGQAKAACTGGQHPGNPPSTGFCVGQCML